MSAFEFVFALLSVIASLALTHLVSGVVHMMRGGSRPSLFLALWLWTAFATTVGNWGASWGLRKSDAFSAWLVLLLLAFQIGQYVFCALVVPASEGSREAPEGAARQQERARFIGAFCALLALAVVANISLAVAARDLGSAAFPSVMSVVQVLLALIALRSAWSWSRIAATVAIVAISTFWMVQACQILATT